MRTATTSTADAGASCHGLQESALEAHRGARRKSTSQPTVFRHRLEVVGVVFRPDTAQKTGPDEWRIRRKLDQIGQVT